MKVPHFYLLGLLISSGQGRIRWHACINYKLVVICSPWANPQDCCAGRVLLPPEYSERPGLVRSIPSKDTSITFHTVTSPIVLYVNKVVYVIITACRWGFTRFDVLEVSLG